jgi:hypothetical protein
MHEHEAEEWHGALEARAAPSGRAASAGWETSAALRLPLAATRSCTFLRFVGCPAASSS